MSNKFGSQHVLLRSIYTKSVFTLFLLSLKGKYYFCLFVCQQFLQLLSLSLSLNTSWIPRKEQLGSEPSESWGIRAHFDEETETEGKRGRGRKTRTHTHTHTHTERERERERESESKKGHKEKHDAVLWASFLPMARPRRSMDHDRPHVKSGI